ncbi:MAG: response regulator transcription factor [Deltaproteobacteria bacterium]|nr:response regulator transcription factor [Deltaproteobacteria bacterium]
MNSRTVTILLADDHTIVRQGLAKLLDGEGELSVIGEAKNGREAITKVEELKPDVVLMDIAMPVLNGIEATRQIRKVSRNTKVIILSMHSHDRFISELFSLGASGYLLKDSTGDDIIKAIGAAVNGDTYLSPSISRRVVEDYVSIKRVKSTEENLYAKLSDREREVFQMMAEGRSTREISDTLCVSMSTVKTHRANIMNKLEIENIAQLFQFAIELGIVEV